MPSFLFKRGYRLVGCALLLVIARPSEAQPLPEPLGRGVVAVSQGNGDVYVGWRLLLSDPENIAFHVYRTGEGAAPVRITEAPLRESTNLIDRGIDLSGPVRYSVRPVIEGVEGEASPTASVARNGYLSIGLRDDLPVGAMLVGTGDLDGDGEFDFVVKRGAQDIDPSQNGTGTDSYKIEAYLRDGTFLWRYDLGPNIRPGIWYSPLVVYDLDGDGRAEVTLKTAETDADLDGDNITDYRDANGRILSGPEYVTVLDGLTGAVLDRQLWIPRGRVSDWGDAYGNRVNRNMIAVAYLDGVRPSLLLMRGLYDRMAVRALDFRNGGLVERWEWLHPSGGGGFQNFRVADIDGDDRDELVHGSIALDDDGATLWNTGEGHGDRLHLTDIDPAHPGLEIWYVQEDPEDYEHPVNLRDAATGALIWGRGDDGWGDVGRGLAADIDPRYPGLEMWGSRGDLYDAQGRSIGTRLSSVNMALWWDADLLRELLDQNRIDKWDWERGSLTRLLTAQGGYGSRNAPMGYGDILGDWREEVWFVSGNNELRIYTTTIPSDRRFPAFMQDRAYRLSVAAQTVGYMQATQPGFYFGPDMPVASAAETSLPPDRFAVERIAPHPVSDRAAFVLTLPAPGAYDVAVYDLLGRALWNETLNAGAPGRYDFRLDFSDRAAGMYVVTVRHTGSGRMIPHRVVVLHP